MFYLCERPCAALQYFFGKHGGIYELVSFSSSPLAVTTESVMATSLGAEPMGSGKLLETSEMTDVTCEFS